MIEQALQPGTIVGGHEIIGLIGSGGMGAVYEAKHQLLGRRAAIKVLLPEHSTNQEVVQRFFDEARATTQIEHPGIVQIFDFGYHDDGSAFLIMELLAGESLDCRLKRVGCLSPASAKRIAKQVASALWAAHDCSIVHRDLKPENIFLVPDPAVDGGERAKLLDFGIAKLTKPGEVSKTRTGTIMGTPMYMSPEQCRGAELVDARADIYSLGCVLFQLICGQPPFNYGSVGELFAAHLSETPTLPSALGGPVGFDALVHKSLAKAPDDRLQTMRDFIDALEGTGTFASEPATRPNQPLAATPRRIAGAPNTTLGQAAGSMAGSWAPSPRRSRGIMLLAGAAVAAVAAIVIIVAVSVGDEPASETVAAQSPSKVAELDASLPVAPDAATEAAQPKAVPLLRISLDTVPSGAELRVGTVDGEVVGVTPIEELAHEASSYPAKFWLVKPGYRSMAFAFKRPGPVARTFKLKPTKKVSARKPRTVRPRTVKPKTEKPKDDGRSHR